MAEGKSLVIFEKSQKNNYLFLQTKSAGLSNAFHYNCQFDNLSSSSIPSKE